MVIIVFGKRQEIFAGLKLVQINQEPLKIMLNVKHSQLLVPPVELVALQLESAILIQFNQFALLLQP